MLSPPASSLAPPPSPPPTPYPPGVGRGTCAHNSGVISDDLGCWGQGKLKMTIGLAVFSQANSSISQCSQDSEKFWKVPPWASGWGVGHKMGGFRGSGAKFLSALSLVWFSYLLSISPGWGWTPAKGNKPQLLLQANNIPEVRREGPSAALPVLLLCSLWPPGSWEGAPHFITWGERAPQGGGLL